MYAIKNLVDLSGGTMSVSIVDLIRLHQCSLKGWQNSLIFLLESTMSDIPQDLRYLPSHEWVRKNMDGTVTIGISDYAQQSLGDVVYVEFPEVGAHVSAREECAVVESVKAASDIFAPVSGEVVEVNEMLEDEPELINSSPYADGWFIRIRPDDMAELDDTLDADAYAEEIE